MRGGGAADCWAPAAAATVGTVLTLAAMGDTPAALGASSAAGMDACAAAPARRLLGVVVVEDDEARLGTETERLRTGV
jgi:hypothetical protein